MTNTEILEMAEGTGLPSFHILYIFSAKSIFIEVTQDLLLIELSLKTWVLYILQEKKAGQVVTD